MLTCITPTVRVIAGAPRRVETAGAPRRRVSPSIRTCPAKWRGQSPSPREICMTEWCSLRPKPENPSIGIERVVICSFLQISPNTIYNG